MSSRIGDLLIRSGLVSSEQLAEAVRAQQAGGGFLGTHLVTLGAVSETALIELLSNHFGTPVVQLEDYVIDSQIVQLIPQALANKHALIPIVRKNSALTVAIADPSNISAVNDVKFLTGLDIQIVLAPEASIRRLHELHYEGGPSYEKLISAIDANQVEVVRNEEELDLSELERATEDAPVVKLVNAILADAIRKGASDIHLEPYERHFRVRFRIDGVLHEIMRPPSRLKNPLISRLKIMASLDIAERRLPQDGRIKLKFAHDKEMDFRVNAMPTMFGEKIVLRLLDKANLQFDLSKLGFSEVQLQHFKEALARPHGMVLVTGPTGSGKTTTLYSGLLELNKESANINTAEDPIEFNLSGVNQLQVNEDIGLTFASALRAFLRQDPDIIMVGEVRDYETAEIAIKASLTGHLVLSTLHTNDAPSTIVRLLNMGVEPFLVASSINLIIAQRLARRVCSHCAEDVAIHPENLVNLGVPAAEARHCTVKHGRGCERCAGTGYRGRIALYEVMPITDELRECILSGASALEIKREAKRQGMVTLRSSGILRLKEGITSIEEVLRVTSPDT